MSTFFPFHTKTHFASCLVYSITKNSDTLLLANDYQCPTQGIMVIDRIDVYSNIILSQKEIIQFKRNPNGFLKIKRGVCGSTPKAHSAGAIVEVLPEMNLIETDFIQPQTADSLKRYLVHKRPLAKKGEV